MKKIDLSAIAVERGSNYPPPFDQPLAHNSRQPLARSQGLKRVGVNLKLLPPGAWSSQRHWHSHEEEFVWVVEGEVTLVSDAGEEILRAGEGAAFKAGEADGHHLINKSAHPAKILEIGTVEANDRCVYPDIDMLAEPGVAAYSHRDGSLYALKPR